MFPKQDVSKYTLDLLFEEINTSVNKENDRVYCDVLVCYPSVFKRLPKIMDYYADWKRSSWKVSIRQLAEEDFFLITFSPKEEVHKSPVYFFWKVLRDEKYVTILSISLQHYAEIRNSLDSLVRYSKGLWFAWVGSQFLENFDLFARHVLGEKTQTYASFQTAVMGDKLYPKKVRVYPLPPRGFVPLHDIRETAKARFCQDSQEITKFSNVRYKIISEEKKINFIFSMTDRTRITFERGDFTLFIILLRPLISETRRILDALRRNYFASSTESKVEGKIVEITQVNLIEALVFKKPKNSKMWFEGILKLFSSDIPNQKLMNFTLMSGNPYFLVHVIDVENSSSIYLSATTEEMQLVPAGKDTKEDTVAKVIDLLQSNVDPTISIR